MPTPRRRPLRPAPRAPLRVAARPLPSGLSPLWLLLALATLVLALAGAGCGGGGEELRAAAATAPPVEALPARGGTLPLEERLNGVVRADNQVVVRPEISGRVVEVLVKSGQAVRKGQVLVRLDPQGLRDQLRQAEADVRLAEAEAAEARARVAELDAEVGRTRRLAAADLVSTMDLETLEARLAAAEAAADRAAARVEQARAALDESRFDLDRAAVRSPTDGRVGRREVEAGTMVDPGTPLFVVGDLDDLVVEVPLAEDMLDDLRAGQPVRIAPRGGGAPVEATLSRISPFLEPGSFTTTGEIDVEAAGTGLRPGMFVTVDVLYGESERATLVPASALWEDPRTGVQGIYVLTGTPRGLEAADDAAGDAPATTGRSVVGGLGGEDVTGEVAPGDPSAEEYPVELRTVTVVAEGRSVFGVAGVEPGEWVVVVGQHLLAGAETPRARVRVVSWDRLLGLQSLQREDLLASFMAKQRRWAAEHGTEPPSNAEYLRAAPAGTETGGDDRDDAPAAPAAGREG